MQSETPTQYPVPREAESQTFEPIDNSAEYVAQETPLIPAYRPDALLEDDLETTMKRPAIRLQSMQQSDTLTMPGKGRVGDRGRATDDNLNNNERLLRGYQFQLAGAYDDAMAEYRIIIRNAPELLSEVISNVRALLKLSPRYSAGFRVLGDAYMRQGEYLQAMEAYNKALTIAKKAKSQSS
jgi:tetratricopeptide (TPR) repeat protein